ncbi:MAG: cob(I)yrinic acid a,c-diamide adenosyltransferase [Caldisericales bacterium]|nr:cob(I)yrinic acid a,c-diamide adenosyltransferase [Caldisericia bacterium]MCE5176378.1 cob(I)yrinic acid a,c-diamide adenosyltransferase [bacterium]NMD14300.1 cob(I)yrinic acid a,c-diamide adenosyltransferase [Caldisericales bacterium]
MSLGKIQVYTGCGKGKTTCAFGLAMRARGHKKSVLFVQFMKGSEDYGELESSRVLGIKVLQFGRPSFVDPKNPDPVDIELAKEGLSFLKKAATSGEWDIIVADEINVAIYFGLISFEETKKMLLDKYPGTEMVLTGRYAHPEIIEMADLVTEMKEIKHYFNTQNLEAREGIEY